MGLIALGRMGVQAIFRPLAVTMLLSIGACAQTDTSSDSSPLGRHASRDEERAAVVANGRAQASGASCRAVELQVVEPPSAFGPLRFAADVLVEGQWVQRFRATGCGASGRLSVLSVVAPGQPVRRIALLPGDTFADPALQRDGLRYADIAAAGVARGCERRQVVNTRFAGSPADIEAMRADLRRNGRLNTPWTETWQVAACGQAIMLRMQFIPNDRGTVISAVPVDPAPAR